jgi:hypothetical protein
VVRDAASQVTRRAAADPATRRTTDVQQDSAGPTTTPTRFEVAWVVVQHARGVPAHLNDATPWTSGPGGPVLATAPFTWMVELGVHRARPHEEGWTDARRIEIPGVIVYAFHLPLSAGG